MPETLFDSLICAVYFLPLFISLPYVLRWGYLRWGRRYFGYSILASFPIGFVYSAPYGVIAVLVESFLFPDSRNNRTVGSAGLTIDSLSIAIAFFGLIGCIGFGMLNFVWVISTSLWQSLHFRSFSRFIANLGRTKRDNEQDYGELQTSVARCDPGLSAETTPEHRQGTSE